MLHLSAGLGLLCAVASCGHDWEEVYDTHFPSTVAGLGGTTGDAGGRAGASATGGTGGGGGETGAAGTGGDGGSGGATTGGTAGATGGAGGASGTAGTAGGGGGAGAAGSAGVGAGAAGSAGSTILTCPNGIIPNAGFEEREANQVADWVLELESNGSGGSWRAPPVGSYEGLRSLELNTRLVTITDGGVYRLVIATEVAARVIAGEQLTVWAAVRVDAAPATGVPVRLRFTYYDDTGARRADLDSDFIELPAEPRFVISERYVEVVPEGAAGARVEIVAIAGVFAYVDSVCVTR